MVKMGQNSRIYVHPSMNKNLVLKIHIIAITQKEV